MMNVKMRDWIHRRTAPALCTGSALQNAVMATQITKTVVRRRKVIGLLI